MALGAVTAAALTDHSSRARGIYLGGVDVSAQAGGAGVTVTSGEVTENGPDAVSTAIFTVDDPNISIGIEDGMPVRWHDHLIDRPLFDGWVDHYSIKPAFGDQGRTIEVNAVGGESILDWSVNLIGYTIPANTRISDAVQTIVGRAYAVGELRAFYDPSGGGLGFVNSTQALPVTASNSTSQGTTSDDITIDGGTTIRAALLQLAAVTKLLNPAGTFTFTVDPWHGLRVWYPSFGPPADYAALTVNDSPAGALVAEDLSNNVDAATARAVYVVGTAVTAAVTDGTGKPGPSSRLDDPTITTVSGAIAAGQAYLAARTSGIRGSFSLLDRAPTVDLHPGSNVTITDARAGFAAQTVAISQLRRRFTAVREDLVVTFGLLPPSGARLLRHFTRKTVS